VALPYYPADIRNSFAWGVHLNLYDLLIFETSVYLLRNHNSFMKSIMVGCFAFMRVVEILIDKKGEKWFRVNEELVYRKVRHCTGRTHIRNITQQA
jgi:hypothetical protein